LLDFVAVREHEREIFIKHIDAHLAGRNERLQLKPRRFRDLVITSSPGSMHLDGEQWPTKNRNREPQRSGVTITVKPAALRIWQIAS